MTTKLNCGCTSHADGSGEQCAIAECDRLRAVNADLLAALKCILECEDCNVGISEAQQARAAIARAEGRETL